MAKRKNRHSFTGKKPEAAPQDSLVENTVTEEAPENIPEAGMASGPFKEELTPDAVSEKDEASGGEPVQLEDTPDLEEEAPVALEETSAEPEKTAAAPVDVPAELDEISAGLEGTPVEPQNASHMPEETAILPEEVSAARRETPVEPEDIPAEPEKIPGTVDFILTDPTVPEPDGKDDKQTGHTADSDARERSESAFGDKTKDTDFLWAPFSDKGKKRQADDTPESMPGEGDVATAPSSAEGKKDNSAKTRIQAGGPFGGKSLGPVVQARAMMRDETGNLVPTPATLPSRLFTVLALIPILLPVTLFLVQVVFSLDTRLLWYSDEVRYASAYRAMVETGNWFVLQLNGAMYPDKPPLFFWFLYGIDEGMKALAQIVPLPFTMNDNLLFFGGVAFSGLLCLLATHALASFVGRVDRRTALASGLVLISCFFFAGMAHYLRMDLLFTALITTSHIFLFHAWVRDKAPLLLVLGYLLAGAAVLTKGPLGLAFPFIAGFFFLLWQGRIMRFFKLDAIFGLIVGLAVPGVWLTLAWLNTGDAFLENILYKQVLARALDTWHHAEPWYHYLITFPLIWLPWTLAFFFLPWGRFMGKGMREGLKVSRTKDGAGIAYLWCALLPGFILLSLVSIKLPVYCLPLFPPLAVLVARAVLQMRPFASTCLQYTMALFLILLGTCLILLPAVPGNYLPIPYVPQGVMVLGGIGLFFGLALLFLVRPRRSEGVLLVAALFATAFAYPAWVSTAPSLDRVLSPFAQAKVLEEYRAAGYFPVTYKVYGGTYTYYAGNIYESPTWEDALAQAAKHPKTVFGLRASFWDTLDEKPEGFVEVNRQKIAERDYVLVARPLMDTEEPEPAKPAEPETASPPEQAEPDPATPLAPPVIPVAPEDPAAAREPLEAVSGSVETTPSAAQPIPGTSAEPAPAASADPAAEQPMEGGTPAEQ